MKKLLILAPVFMLTMATSAQTLLDTALNFSVKDIDGYTINLFEKLDDGKTVVIDFFSAS